MMPVGAAAWFLLRATRHGPLVPARIRLIDHAPQDPPDNKLDRGRLSVVLCADIAGREIDPERMLERLTARDDWTPANAPGHWRYAQPITRADYEYRVARHAWARDHRPADPTAAPGSPADPRTMPVPEFASEETA